MLGFKRHAPIRHSEGSGRCVRGQSECGSRGRCIADRAFLRIGAGIGRADIDEAFRSAEHNEQLRFVGVDRELGFRGQLLEPAGEGFFLDHKD